MNAITEQIINDITIMDHVFEKEHVDNEDFERIEFENIHFIKCSLLDCHFENGAFYNCTFEECDLSNSQFTRCFFKNCTFNNTKAMGISLTEGIIKDTTIIDSNFKYLSGANSKWEKCKINNSIFEEASLADIKFKQVTFKETNLSHVDIFRTIMKNIDLTTCDIQGIMLSSSLEELKGAKINMYQAAQLIQLLGIKVVE